MNNSKHSRNEKTALITGASSGIGYELAREFAADGYDLVLASRNEARLGEIAAELQQAYGIRVRVVPIDLEDSDGPRKLYDTLQDDSVQVDVLVNNAGFGTYGKFVDTSLEENLSIVQVNADALTHLTKLFLADMIVRGRGGILNVASTGAFQPGPWMAVYYATKAYVLSFSEAIAHELRDTGVHVTALCPGATLTGFQKRSGMEGSRIFRGKVMDAATVARIGYRQFKKKKRVVIPGRQNRWMAFAVRFGPRNLVTAVADKVLRPETPSKP